MSEDKGRRKGRGKDEVPPEELGWIEDLRQAREQGGDLGPGTDDEPAPPTRAGRRGLLGGRAFSRSERGGDQREDSRWDGLRGDDPPPVERVRDEAPRGREVRPPREQRPRAAEPRSVEPRAPEPRGAEPRAPEPRGAEPRAAEPRGADPRGADPRAGDLPGQPRSARDRLGSRFASLRGLRGGERAEPVVPAPAISPLPPDVLSPPLPDRPAADRSRPHRDPDEPGRHETGTASGRRSAEPGRPSPSGRPGPGRPVPPAGPGQPGWHDLATGEKSPVRGPAGRAGPPPGIGQPRRGTGEQSSVPPRRGTGEQPSVPPRRGTAEQPPVPPRHATGEQPPVPPRRGPGEQPLAGPRWMAGEQPLTGPRRGLAEPPPPARRSTGENPAVGLRRSTGEQAPVVGRRGAADPAPARPWGGGEGWRRSQLRQQVRENRRLRLITLAVVAVVLLAALPAIFLARDAAADPVFTGLDSLQLPSWAAHSHQDLSSGNRWCVHSCRLRERTWRSDRTAVETSPVYEKALTDAGWRPWPTTGCPKVPGLTCWQRDEYAMDLYTRDIPCDLASLPPVPTGSVDPSASAPVPAPTGSEPPATCVGSLVSAKVANRVDPLWHG